MLALGIIGQASWAAIATHAAIADAAPELCTAGDVCPQAADSLGNPRLLRASPAALRR